MGVVWILGLLACCALVSAKELTDAEKKILSEKLGINLDDLRTRLEKLGPHTNTTEHTENHRAQADGIPPLSNGVVDEHDILLVNQRSGMAPYLYQGDIMMTAEQLTYLETIKSKSLSEADRARTKRQATKVYAKWDREIFYLVDNNVSNKTKLLIGKAVKYLEERTALKFRTQYPVPEGIRNQLHIGIIVHEVMHALGINHMQTRSDRDEYVTYMENNVAPDLRHNFIKMTEAESENYTPYEYGSVMHYAATAGAMTSGAMALVPKDPAYLRTIGGHTISFYDMIMINKHYENIYEEQKAKCPPLEQPCQNGGVMNHHCTGGCFCPGGYSGQFCEKEPYDRQVATRAWSSFSIVLGEFDNEYARDDFSLIHLWISAPQGKTIEIRVVPSENDNLRCSYGCPYNGVEVKTNANPRIVNPRICCPEQLNTTLTSNLNPTPIIFYNRISWSSVNIVYRYVDGEEICTAKDALAESTCQTLKSNGYCTSLANSIDVIKFTCGKTCELCGKMKQPCRDVLESCATLPLSTFCSTDKNLAEYACGKSCGFCVKPT